MNDFEFDKIIIAVAFGILAIIFSNNIGKLMYGSNIIIISEGYKVEATNNNSTEQVTQSQELPEIIDMKAVMAAADPQKGATIFKKCAICHDISNGGPDRVGPNLWGIVGLIAAHRPAFAYSDGMRKRHEDKIVWTYEQLYRYLYSPKKMVPGTKMAFAGIKDDKDRANLVSYLGSMADNPRPYDGSN